MSKNSIDSFSVKSKLTSSNKKYSYYSIKEAEKSIGNGVSKLPFSLKVLLENLLRHEDGSTVKSDDIKAFAKWVEDKKNSREIAYRPSRVLMQDFTGVPAVVDLAAMRDAMKNLGGEPKKINPLSAVDLVIDHSVMVDKYGTESSFEENVTREFERNKERYEFLKWGQKAFDNFRVVPPGTGICHQVNLEYLAKVIWSKEDGGETFVFPDTVVGTDSHTTMICYDADRNSTATNKDCLVYCFVYCFAFLFSSYRQSTTQHVLDDSISSAFLSDRDWLFRCQVSCIP
jgi:aconitate hydratase